MLDILQDSSPRHILDVLADVPRGLSTTYRLMLERVCDRDPRSVDRCRKVLHWCVAARRLLTVDELLLALAVSEGASSHEEYDAETDRSDSRRVLRLECGSLIHVLKDNTVQLLHTSLREYLVFQHTGPVGERLLSISCMQVADTVYHIGLLHVRQGHDLEVLEWYERALAGYEKVLGKVHPSTLDTVLNIGGIHVHQGHDPDALQWCERALAGYEKVLGKDHPQTLSTAQWIADIRARVQ